MGKMTSLLEKYKLIEKEEESASADSSHTNEISQEEPITNLDASILPSDVDSTSSKTPTISSIPEETVTESTSEYITSDSLPKQETISPINYNQLLSIDQVYKHLQLNQAAITDTVFLLENLIKALPAELPEFVKKTTVNNIIEASAMNLSKLLEDGRVRAQSLQQFSTNYTQTHSEEIATLKVEIARLSAIIADYHQQIKNKETLIAEETNLIQTEQHRIQSILEFFSN